MRDFRRSGQRPHSKKYGKIYIVLKEPPHRIVNVYGSPGSGKSFLGWLMERERYATYCLWSQQRQPAHPRLALDNAYTD